MTDSYADTRSRLETYFDQTAAKTWERLTSDAPVSRIRATVRAGRDKMRERLLAALPDDLTGARVLDAGCGAGPMSCALADRGAQVLGVDISPSLLEVAKARTPQHLAPLVSYQSGDMVDLSRGRFDFVVAMDSLIHYRPADAAKALTQLSSVTDDKIVFTIAPKTPLLTIMHVSGKLFPRSDRSPAIVPTSVAALQSELGKDLRNLGRVNTAFYKSQAMELPA
ncbi:MAG: magnesium protoporphyrin IX methyltransferase [Rhodobacteraceae bacterium]|nr:magnesium protoporphyrin IX methyltransferase [Paracoccaceae bacterium]